MTKVFGGEFFVEQDEMVNEPNFLVKVTCMTYNHANYITDAMDGFVMQQTSFPFVCIIIDDASTDGEPGIIKKYIDEYFDRLDIGLATEDETDEYLRIYARHKENKNCYFCVLLLKYNHYSIKKPKTNNLAGFAITRKYLAICEGDDYWTDPLKLQKQVDFLEQHPEYSMCFHRVGVVGSDAKEFERFTRLAERDYSAKEILENWTIPTASVVYRPFAFEKNPVLGYGDIFMWLQLAEKGKLYCMGFLGGMYRRNENSVTYGFKLNNYVQLLKLYKFFKKRFPQLKETAEMMIDKQVYYIGNAQYQPGVLKYRLLHMLRHPKLLFSTYLTTTLFSYTPLRKLKFWKKNYKNR